MLSFHISNIFSDGLRKNALRATLYTEGIAVEDWIAYCGVDCRPCPDLASGKCPGCRKTAWGEDPCMPVGCCRGKGIECCGECGAFPCPMMAEFYEESESHREAYRRMRAMR